MAYVLTYFSRSLPPRWDEYGFKLLFNGCPNIHWNRGTQSKNACPMAIYLWESDQD